MSGMAQTPASGILFALSAGILWGFVPVYINFFGNVDPLEIVAHRSLWSLVMLFGIVMWRRQISMALQVFVNKKQLFSFLITTCFLSANWTVYVYAVQSGHVASAALGYFIYPILTVLLGIIILRERLDRCAWLAICCVIIGVLVKSFFIAGLPWIALTVAVTFSFYALVRKGLEADPISGLFIETLMLLPITLAFLGWLAWAGQSIFFGGGVMFVFLAMFVGAGLPAFGQLAVVAELRACRQFGIGERADAFRVGVLDVGVGLPALGKLAVAAQFCKIWKFSFST